MKKQLYFFLIVIILGLSYLKWQSWAHPTAIVFSPTPSPLVSPSPQVRLLTTPYFSLEYPVEATSNPVSESPDSELWQISYMGDKQRASGRTQTELFHGYAIPITRFETAGDELEPDLVQAEADRLGIVEACGEENATLIDHADFLNREVHRFFGGCLGEATHYYFMHEDSLYRITSMVVGEEIDKKSYQSTVDQIFTSLKFTEAK